ncbi:MAG: hypothetical protein KGO94_07330 [Alphaproteobacteria bacterium]|nr:hypothetical protein [Alphaproteobacteria bacterium]
MNNIRTLAITVLLILGRESALASSEEAWQELANQVKKKCLAETSKSLTNPEIVVDPYGSESYGLAIVSGEASGTKVSYICLLDKASGRVEIGSQLPWLYQ